MGGNLYNTPRIDTETYYKIYRSYKTKLLQYLRDCSSSYFSFSVRHIKFYRNKETHGDIDILVKLPDGDSDDDSFQKYKSSVIDFIKNDESCSNIVISKDSFSHLYHQDQDHKYHIDILMIREKSWKSARFFYDYDLGTFLGILCKHLPFEQVGELETTKYKFSFGPEGIYHTHHSKYLYDQKKTKIVLTSEVSEICRIFDISYSRYQVGFDDVHQTYDFVISSQYFSPNYFIMITNADHILPDEKKHKYTLRSYTREFEEKYPEYKKIDNLINSNKRKRLLKRPNYLRFLEYIQSKIFWSISDENEKNVVVDVDTSTIDDKISELNKKDYHEHMLRQKFNGKVIKEHYPYLNGKELGQMMKYFKKLMPQFKQCSWHYYIEDVSQEELLTHFEHICTIYKVVSKYDKNDKIKIIVDKMKEFTGIDISL